MKNTEVIVFTDGASRGNPGPGGWGGVIVDANHVTELGGRKDPTTNNQMELAAAIETLKKVPEGSTVRLHTDSSYLINGITKWIHAWKRNDWQTKTKEDVMNKDLWMDLDDAMQGKSVQWKYVGGHVGILGNERCDRIATGFADDLEVSLYNGPLEGYDFADIINVAYDVEKMSKKKSSSSRSKLPAYSYISSVKGKIELHKTWPECEKRVKGVAGARYKKALDAAEESQIIKEFSGK